MTPEEKIEALIKLNADCHKCTKCSLYTNVPPIPGWQKGPHVFGAGKVSSKIMIVGQNPGIKEVQQQRPFVGPAGEKLNEAISSVGLNRRDLYITNSVLCYTIGNSVPPIESIWACRDFLVEQIKIVEPEVVVCCGASAFRSFKSKFQYSTAFCKSPTVIETDIHPRVIATVHPAYVIYKHEEAMEILKAGLMRAKTFLEESYEDYASCNAAAL
jgi:DNA polymerase